MKHTFIHLRLHSEFSLIDGIVRIKRLVKRLRNNDMPAVALTDQINLFGVVKFYETAVANGIKPIIGADIYLANPEDVQNPFLMTLLCQNIEGYRHLTRVISKAYIEGQQHGVPQVQAAWIKQYSSGLIALSGGREGDIGRALLAGKFNDAKKILEKWKKIFPQRFYMELQRTGRIHEAEYIQAAVELADHTQIPVVATNDVRFLNESDYEAHEARVCIYDGYTLNDNKRPRLYSAQQYLRTNEEMETLFSDIPEALANTVEIAKRCNVELPLGNVFFPNFPIPEGYTVEDYLTEKAEEGLSTYFTSIDGDSQSTSERQTSYQQRLQIELNVINSVGFASYFLIVADFIQWAKENDIPVGPGRGSGAGSLVAFVLGITGLDPLEHSLLFERFLNPERVSMPDFDIDFCMEGRDRVIDYVTNKYGHKSVSQIITFGSMTAKAVVRDVGRVLGHPYGFVDKIAKLIPFQLGITLEQALDQEKDFQQRYNSEEEVKILIDLARKLEGVTRNAGKHAGGVVIAPSRLVDFVPLYCEAGSENVVTQFDKDDVEKVGLVKFDFLGLRTLTIINWTIQTINQRRQQQALELIDITRIPLDDEKAFLLLKSCQTTAVFQLESRGMKDLIKRLQPDCFEDITALVALFRPGPLQSGMVDDFINRKHGFAKVEYFHPDIEPILRSTYGVILYQEQVMKIPQILSGYTLGGADLLRRAMGKKKPEEMAKQRDVFINGATQRGVSREVATYIFDVMEKFAGYGFNKSHSAAYALIAYQTAWLKAHYPAAFMAAVLSSDMDNTDKVVHFIDECRALNLNVLPPDVNQSHYKFTMQDDTTILYGLGAIKGIGSAAIESIIFNRTQEGPYRDLFDFCRRVDLRKTNRRVLEALIRSGAMDTLGPGRATLMASLNNMLRAAEQHKKNDACGQRDLFSDKTIAMEYAECGFVSAESWSDEERLRGEKETLGLYLTGHPINYYLSELSQITTGIIKELQPMSRSTATIAGFVVGQRKLSTKRGDRMAVLVLDDNTARIDVTVFAEQYSKYKHLLVNDSLLIVQGELGKDDFTGNVRLTADRIFNIQQMRETSVRQLVITLDAKETSTHLLEILMQTLKPFCGGECKTVINYAQDALGAQLLLGPEWHVRVTDSLLEQLRKLVSQDAVCLVY